jgi:hypothetical protein
VGELEGEAISEAAIIEMSYLDRLDQQGAQA